MQSEKESLNRAKHTEGRNQPRSDRAKCLLPEHLPPHHPTPFLPARVPNITISSLMADLSWESKGSAGSCAWLQTAQRDPFGPGVLALWTQSATAQTAQCYEASQITLKQWTQMDLFVDGERGASLAQTTWSTSVSNPRLLGCFYELFLLVYLSLCLVVHLIVYHIISACSRITVFGLSDSVLSFVRPQLTKITACTFLKNSEYIAIYIIHCSWNDH